MKGEKMPKFTRSFITGSWAYGSPKTRQGFCTECSQDILTGSDVDLVTLVSKEDLAILTQEGEDGQSGDVQSASLQFGKLNLICETDDVAFELWKRGTKILRQLQYVRGKDVTREEAVRFFERLSDPWQNGWTDSLEFLKLTAKGLYDGTIIKEPNLFTGFRKS